MITGQDGRYILRDLRSLNGAFIRGERIGEHYLSDGDEVNDATHP